VAAQWAHGVSHETGPAELGPVVGAGKQNSAAASADSAPSGPWKHQTPASPTGTTTATTTTTTAAPTPTRETPITRAASAGSSLLPAGVVDGAAPATVEEPAGGQQTGALYFLSSAADPEEQQQPAKPGELGGEQTTLLPPKQNNISNNNSRAGNGGALWPPAKTAADAAAAAAAAAGQPLEPGPVPELAGLQQQVSAGPAGRPAAQASQSFDTVVSQQQQQQQQGANSSQARTPKPGEQRLVALQLANGSTAFLVQDAATTSRPRPVYANWTDYKLLMLMHQQQQQQQAANRQPVVYHSNTDPVRPSQPAEGAPSAPKGEPHTMTVTLTSDLNSQFQQHALSLAGDQQLVLKDQHSASTGPPAGQSAAPISATSASSRITSTTTTTTTTAPTATSAKTPQTTTAPSSTISAPSEPPDSPRATSGSSSASGPAETPQDSSSSGALGEQSGAGEAAGSGAEQSPIGSGIASLLGSLLESFMPAAGSSEAADQQQQQPPLDLATGADASGPSFLAPEGEQAEAQPQPQQQQHNDRRFGLDLSFRQQNELPQNSSHSFQTLLGAQDTSGEQAGEPASQCLGYCALDQFLHLCDSFYATADCSRSQKCCISNGQQPATSNGADPEQQTSQLHATGPRYSLRQQQQSFCRGTCLPIYHSSLCTKPNELTGPTGPQLELGPSGSPAGACLPNQVCCSPPGSANDALDDNHIESAATSAAAAEQVPFGAETYALRQQQQQQQQTESAGEPDGRLLESNVLAAALVPPPPPALLSGGHARPANSELPMQLLLGQPQLSTGPKQPHGSASNRHHSHQTQQSSAPNGGPNAAGGFVNQLLSMFKSSGSSSARHKARPLSSNSHPAANPMGQFGPQTVPNLQQQQQPPMLMSASMPRAQQQLAQTTATSGPPPPSSQRIFMAQQQQQQQLGQQTKQMLAPNGQPFGSGALFLPDNLQQQFWAAGYNGLPMAASGQPVGGPRNKQVPNHAGPVGVGLLEQVADGHYLAGADQLGLLQKQMQYAASLMRGQQQQQQSAVGQTAIRPQQQQSFAAAHPQQQQQQQSSASEQQQLQQLFANYNHQLQTQRLPPMRPHSQPAAANQLPPRWPSGGDKSGPESFGPAADHGAGNSGNNALIVPAGSRQKSPTSSAFSAFNAADATPVVHKTMQQQQQQHFAPDQVAANERNSQLAQAHTQRQQQQQQAQAQLANSRQKVYGDANGAPASHLLAPTGGLPRRPAANQVAGQQAPQRKQQQQPSAQESGDTNVVALSGGWQQLPASNNHQEQWAAPQRPPRPALQQTAGGAPGRQSVPREQQAPLASSLAPTVSQSSDEQMHTGANQQHQWMTMAAAKPPASQPPAPTPLDSTPNDDQPAPVADSGGSLPTGTLASSSTELQARPADRDSPSVSDEDSSSATLPTKPGCPFVCMAPLLTFKCSRPNRLDSNYACPNAGALCCVTGPERDVQPAVGGAPLASDTLDGGASGAATVVHSIQPSGPADASDESEPAEEDGEPVLATNIPTTTTTTTSPPPSQQDQRPTRNRGE